MNKESEFIQELTKTITELNIVDIYRLSESLVKTKLLEDPDDQNYLHLLSKITEQAKNTKEGRDEKSFSKSGHTIYDVRLLLKT